MSTIGKALYRLLWTVVIAPCCYAIGYAIGYIERLFFEAKTIFDASAEQARQEKEARRRRR